MRRSGRAPGARPASRPRDDGQDGHTTPERRSREASARLGLEARWNRESGYEPRRSWYPLFRAQSA
jgi:hypothetical protein